MKPSDCQNVIPQEALDLIRRKLKQFQREFKDRCKHAKVTHIKTLMLNISESISNKRHDLAFIRQPAESYKTIGSDICKETKEWPTIVWQALLPILEKLSITKDTSNTVASIIDEFTWIKVEEHPAHNFINKDTFQEMVLREASRYGGLTNRQLEQLNRSLDLEAVAVKASIMNTARQAINKVKIEADEYIYKSLKKSPPEEAQENNSPQVLFDKAPTKTTKTSGLNTLALLKNKNDWYEVIYEMTNKFVNKYNRMPTELEAWVTLREEPPTCYSYKITSGKHRGEDAIFMDEKSLDRKAFKERWSRYSQTSSN